MIKVSVLYPQQQGTKFDMAYYLSYHIPMVQRLVGGALKGVSVEQGISGMDPGSPPAYIAAGHLLFDSVAAFQSSFGPHTNRDHRRHPQVHQLPAHDSDWRSEVVGTVYEPGVNAW